MMESNQKSKILYRENEHDLRFYKKIFYEKIDFSTINFSWHEIENYIYTHSLVYIE